MAKRLLIALYLIGKRFMENGPKKAVYNIFLFFLFSSNLPFQSLLFFLLSFLVFLINFYGNFIIGV